jgi:phage terminase Nu1 subunit (DNA packaging protein)
MDAAPVTATKPAGISHDAAARLIALPPAELEALVAAGHVRRNDRNSYSVPVLVQDYAAYLRDADNLHPTQADLAAHLDLSDRSIRELEAKLPLPADYPRAAFRVAYIKHLREVAAGRSGSSPDSLDLAAERAALAKAQREGIEIKNAVLRGEYASIKLLAQVLAAASQAVAERFDHLPGLLSRACPELSEAGRNQVSTVIARARDEWVRSTAELVTATLEQTPEDDEASDEPLPD